MRKGLAFCLVAAMCLALGLTAATAAMTGMAKDVAYTQTTLYGDPAAADGLNVSVRYTYHNRLYWFTDHASAKADDPQTEFTYAPFGLQFPTESQTTPFLLYVDGSGDLSDTYNQFRLKNPSAEPYGLLQGYQAFEAATPEGEATQGYLRLADFCEYYPIGGYMHPQLNRARRAFWSLYEDSALENDAGEAARAINAFLRIPVGTEDELLVYVEKRKPSAHMESVALKEQRRGDWFDFQIVSAITENTLYFTFDAHTSKGNLVDTSQIPGGYGLYAVTLKEGNADWSTLRCCIPLNPEFRPANLYADEDRLLLECWDNSTGYLQVLDPYAGSIAQQLALFSDEPEGYCWTQAHEDFLLCAEEDTVIRVFTRGADGQYFCAIDAKLPDSDALNNVDLFRHSVAFDGSRIAFADQLFNENGRAIPGYRLSVYDRDGLQYCGTYASNLALSEREGYENRNGSLEAIEIQFQ